MKDGFKIADIDTHLMEPDYVFEKYIDERYKSAAPKMGSRLSRDDELSWSRASRSRAKRASIRWRRPAF